MQTDAVFLLCCYREELQDRYGDKLTKSMSGALHEVFSRVMRAVSGKKITIPESFKGYVYTVGVGVVGQVGGHGGLGRWAWWVG